MTDYITDRDLGDENDCIKSEEDKVKLSDHLPADMQYEGGSPFEYARKRLDPEAQAQYEKHYERIFGLKKITDPGVKKVVTATELLKSAGNSEDENDT